MEKPKSGWKTSELYVVIVGAALSIALAMGYLSPTEVADIESTLVAVIDAITKLIEALAPVIGSAIYVWSRTKVKIGK